MLIDTRPPVTLKPSPMTPVTQAPPRRLLVQIIGQQRSGNHAIIRWLSSLFPTAMHANDLPHDFFMRPNVAATTADCNLFSFEDSFGWLRGGNLLESVALVDPAAFPDFDCRVLHILRDPYNCWASRVKAREVGKLSSTRALEPFVRDWTALARLCLTQPEAFILYNRWFEDQAYRKQIAARLGGRYSERTLGEVPGEGGGSSFDGFVRPSYATILRKFDYYLTANFRRRFLKRPGSYLFRLFSPNIDARQLQVDRRWEHVVGQKDAQDLFANAEVQVLSREIFGFCVDACGRRVSARPAKLPTADPAKIFDRREASGG
jgi:hypothetical protein